MGLNNRFGGWRMQSYLTSKRLMTKLGMLRSGKKRKTLVVVEGITDYRVYKKLFNLECCEVIIGENKENVVEAIKLCEKAHLEGIIGIVDADFWHMQLENKSISSQLFVTDAHDLECMLLCSRAFEDVFLEYGDDGKRAKLERMIQEKLVLWMLKNVSLIGYLRKISLDRNLELRFSELNFEKFMDMNRLEIQVEPMIQEILFHSRKHHQYKVKQITGWLYEEIKQVKDHRSDVLWQICCGHDLMEWLTLGFINRFGNYNAKKLSSGQLEGSFRLTYHRDLFAETNLYKDLQEWERTQHHYRLFMAEEAD